MLKLQLQRLVARLVSPLGRHFPIFQHRVDHEVATLERMIRMIDGRVVARRLRQSRQQRGFF